MEAGVDDHEEQKLNYSKRNKRDSFQCTVQAFAWVDYSKPVNAFGQSMYIPELEFLTPTYEE